MLEQFSSDLPLAAPRAAFELCLASTSPRRAQLLRTARIPFTIVASSFDEPSPTAQDDAAPAQYVERLARDKAAHCDLSSLPAVPRTSANSVLNTNGIQEAPPALILTADTVVWHRGRVLGKPRDAGHARAMLMALRGETHQVFTGICLRHGDEYHVAHEVTTVRFRVVSDQWITRYIETGEPMDKAGAYAAQDRGALLIERIEGDFWNVVGLPLACLGRLLESLGAPVEAWW